MERVYPGGSVDSGEFYYPPARSARLHPDVEWLMAASNADIVSEYSASRPWVDGPALLSLLSRPCQEFLLSGTDLFPVRDAVTGEARMMVLECNSCPSGQSSMPCVRSSPPTSPGQHNGYVRVIQHTFAPLLPALKAQGYLAVVFDKNEVEARAYAAAMAHLCQEEVLLVPFHREGLGRDFRWSADEQLQVYVPEAPEPHWLPVRAAFRYVTKQPHNRFPVVSNGRLQKEATLVVNPIVACLAGGRNKSMGAKAFSSMNRELKAQGVGLDVLTPLTLYDVPWAELRDIVTAMGYRAVVKVPYSNCGQGVFTIVNRAEMETFLSVPHRYERYVVQSVVGSAEWPIDPVLPSSWSHRCAVVKGRPYVFDVRSLVISTPQGFKPLAMAVRRAGTPLEGALDLIKDSFPMLATNLTEVAGKLTLQVHCTANADISRLHLMDEDYQRVLGLTRSDLLDTYVQSCLATLAIDRLATRSLQAMDGEGKAEQQPLLFTQLEHTLLSELM